MQTKLAYPAIFTRDERKECYHVKFIDFECSAVGETIADAMFVAREAMEQHLAFSRNFPSVTINIKDIKLEEKQFISFIEVDMLKFYKKYNNKAVKKTLTIPKWLNELAEENGINFSQVLQEALKEELKIE